MTILYKQKGQNRIFLLNLTVIHAPVAINFVCESMGVCEIFLHKKKTKMRDLTTRIGREVGEREKENNIKKQNENEGKKRK